ncbi:hypothetical protein JVT61DRAFT_4521 [Boletus reticuloceps]|uniref:Uncharacterized protein n=1 Tax=Boletus reticuloceps TaxID=495285 RepID=A0A8I3A8Z2_9AGAM|nr:hypothetical protein JVT61DRAFT_4521 [Boletus reticuloceps]
MYVPVFNAPSRIALLATSFPSLVSGAVGRMSTALPGETRSRIRDAAGRRSGLNAAGAQWLECDERRSLGRRCMISPMFSHSDTEQLVRERDGMSRGLFLPTANHTKVAQLICRIAKNLVPYK